MNEASLKSAFLMFKGLRKVLGLGGPEGDNDNETANRMQTACKLKSKALPASPNPSTRKPVTWLSSRFTLSEQSNFQTEKKKKGKRVCYGFPFLSISTPTMAIAMMIATAAATTYIMTSELVTVIVGSVVGSDSGAADTLNAVSAYEAQ